MAWDHAQKSAIWWKARESSGRDGSEFRIDACGALIAWKFYGDRNSRYGWEVDHIDPDGGDDISNLRPLQWENNVAKSDGRTTCVVRFNGVANVPVRG